MAPELFKEFCFEFTREVNRLRMERDADAINRRDELERVDRELDKAIDAILAGVPGEKLKDRIGYLEDRKIELIASLENQHEAVPLLHPNLAEIYRERIARLCETLNEENGRTSASEALRVLIDQILMVPEDGELKIVLRGDLAAILQFAANKKNPAPFRGPGFQAI
jgi:hypothetical protein